MKPLSTDQKPAGRTQCALSAVGCLLSAASARASFVFFVFFVVSQSCVALASDVSASEPPSMLTYAWRAEATRPAEVAVTIRQGETLRLACTLLERSKPIAVPDDATSRFFWRDADAKGNYWAKEATRQGSELAFVWTAACDVGAKRYDFVLSLESPTAGTLYRASGLLIMQSSPGFNPASLQPPDVFAEIVAATQAAILEVAATKVDLSAEAQAREEADSAITQAVNAQAGVLEQHQGYLSTLSGNFNALYSSYTNTVSELQATDAAHESALAAKAALEHTHAIADTEGLQTALNAKADESAVLLADPLIVPPPTGTDRANFFGWVGTLADWGLSGEALDLRVVTLTRRNNAGGVTNATFYARIVHVGESGEIEVLFQSIGAINWSTIAYNASCSFSLSHLPGAPYPSATERVALYFVTDPAAPAWKSVGTFGLKTQLNASGGIANEPTSQTTLPGGQAFRPILGWAYTDLAATLEGQLALLDNTKADAAHTHAITDTTGLQAALDGKAALEHTHSQYLTTESDPTVSAWAKAATKPTYTAAEVGAQPAGKYVTYDTTSHRLDAVSKETSFAGGIRTDSFKTLYGTPFFNTVSDYGFNITGFYRLNGYRTENNPLLEWDVKTQKSKLTVTTVYEGGKSLSDKYAPISHTHTVSAITDFPTTWDWANLTNKPTTFPPATHNHAIADTTGLQAALDALAPLSSVTCTTNNVTYIWQWDEAAGTFALVER